MRKVDKREGEEESTTKIPLKIIPFICVFPSQPAEDGRRSGLGTARRILEYNVGPRRPIIRTPRW